MTIEELWAKVPPVIGCKQCGDCCGHVPFSVPEINRVFPYWPDEGPEDCRFLVNGKCSVYEDRPLICRLFGACSDMPCAHGARAERQLSDEEVKKLFVEYEGFLKDGEVWA